MELRHLRYFRAVAEELHFGRAAERLHIAQPPLSQQIRALEAELAVPLLTRSTRRVELTPAGAAYLDRAVAILDAVDAAAEAAQRIAAGSAGRLVIGCVGSATYSLLPALVRALREELPDVDVTVRGEMLAPAQVIALVAGEIDLGVLRPPVDHPAVRVQTIRRDRLLVALPDGHRLAASDEVEIADLRGDDFVAHAGHGHSVMSSAVTTLCAQAGFVPRIRQEVEETSTLITLVAAGLGVAVVPEPTVALGIPGVRYRSLAGPTPPMMDLLVAHPARPRSPLVERASMILRRIAEADRRPA